MTIEQINELIEISERINKLELFIGKYKESSLWKNEPMLYKLYFKWLREADTNAECYDYGAEIAVDQSIFGIIIPLLEKELEELKAKLSSIHIYYENKRIGD